MKSIERHKLKENEFAKTVARTKAAIESRGPDVARIAIAALVIVTLVGGYTWWRQARKAHISWQHQERAPARMSDHQVVVQR